MLVPWRVITWKKNGVRSEKNLCLTDSPRVVWHHLDLLLFPQGPIYGCHAAISTNQDCYILNVPKFPNDWPSIA